MYLYALGETGWLMYLVSIFNNQH